MPQMIITFKKVPKKITFTLSECLEGIKLCLINSVRLNENAKILLNSKGSSSNLAYSLWSLAMEEYGRALMLHEKSLANKISFNHKDLFESHDLKFKKAKECLSGLPDKIKLSLVIQSNIANESITVQNNRIGNIVIGAGMTGVISDCSHNGVDITVELRFQSIYVGIDEQKKNGNIPI